MGKIKILDCTLRDGGYYCDWIYSKNLVSDYLNTMASSGIDFVEIGLRSNVSNKFLGPFAYCSEDFLKTLNIPKNLKLGVMINASEYISDGQANLTALKKMFVEKSQSAACLVRIAAHLYEIPATIPLIKEFHSMGYLVGLNLMQTGGKSVEEIVNTINLVKDLKELEVLYFADSLGNMRPEDVHETTKLFLKHWPKEIGIHTHDNMGMALSNSLEAVRSGVTWVDGTVLGMGRGAGNVRTEYLLLEAQQRNWGDFHPDALFPLVQGPFTALQKKYEWGTNLMYYISAQYKIHPTYVQTLLSEHNYSSDRLLEILKKLSSKESSSYSSKKLNEAIAFGSVDCSGNWNPAIDIKSDSVFVIGAGDSIEEHLEAVSSFIKRKKIPTLSLNINRFLDPGLISYFIASHPLRILFDIEKYKKLAKPLVAPLELLKGSSKTDMGGVEIKNLGIKITADEMSCGNGVVSIPNPLALMYTLSLLSSTSVKTIYLAGFDGYTKGDNRNEEVQAAFDLFQKKYPNITLISLTPTSFKLKQGSIYDSGI